MLSPGLYRVDGPPSQIHPFDTRVGAVSVPAMPLGDPELRLCPWASHVKSRYKSAWSRWAPMGLQAWGAPWLRGERQEGLPLDAVFI